MQFTAILRKRTGIAVAVLLVAMVAGAGGAGSVRADAAGKDETTAKPAVRGKDGRRTARFDRLIASFKDDRRAIYTQYGFPSYRHYEMEFETRTEHWIYMVEDLEFIFIGDRLISRQ
jgi:hypothetical protein